MNHFIFRSEHTDTRSIVKNNMCKSNRKKGKKAAEGDDARWYNVHTRVYWAVVLHINFHKDFFLLFEKKCTSITLPVALNRLYANE